MIILKSTVNTLVTGTTSINDIIPSLTFYPIHAFVYAKNVSGLVSLPTISIGTNASSYNNIFPSTVITQLTSNGQYLIYNLSGILNGINASTVINANVTLASTATTCTLLVGLLGTYIS